MCCVFSLVSPSRIGETVAALLQLAHERGAQEDAGECDHIVVWNGTAAFASLPCNELLDIQDVFLLQVLS